MKHRTVADGDGTPMWVPIEPDPDDNPFLDELIEDRLYKRGMQRLAERLAQCPHNCKGCTCRTDPRQLVLPFGEVS